MIWLQTWESWGWTHGKDGAAAWDPRSPMDRNVPARQLWVRLASVDSMETLESAGCVYTLGWIGQRRFYMPRSADDVLERCANPEFQEGLRKL